MQQALERKMRANSMRMTGVLAAWIVIGVLASIRGPDSAWIAVLLSLALVLHLIELTWSASLFRSTLQDVTSSRLVRQEVWSSLLILGVWLGLTSLQVGWLTGVLKIAAIALGAVLLLGVVGNIVTQAQATRGTWSDRFRVARLYEASRNPNIRKARGAYFLASMPLLAVAILWEQSLAFPLIVLSVDRVYTRLRMCLPVALFLTGDFDRSRDTWLRCKSATAVFSIAGLVVEGDEAIPSNIAIHQDVVRVPASMDWKAAVKLLANYVRIIIVDPGRMTEALAEEIRILGEISKENGEIVFVKSERVHTSIYATIETMYHDPVFIDEADLRDLLATRIERYTGIHPREVSSRSQQILGQTNADTSGL